MRGQMTSRNSTDSLEERASKIEKRISEKIHDYKSYAFSSTQDCSLKTFFDLAQEFDGQHDFYCICALIPKLFFNYECALHLAEKDGSLAMVCHSGDPCHAPPAIEWPVPPFVDEPLIRDGSYFIPIKGNIKQLYDLPCGSEKGILGIFEICHASELSDDTRFFLEKYANRIGFQLHNRIIHQKNREHLQFIKSLVNDIGHNVIVPNMFFKLFFRRMKGKINRAKDIGDELKSKVDGLNHKKETDSFKEILSLSEELNYINESMDEQFQQIISHYEQTSLFLETLLRRSHFEQGKYVPEPKRIDFHKRIIQPQLERYLPRLRERNIAVKNQISSTREEKIMVVADPGLISQAYANLFSNAVKYTRKARDAHGDPKKFISFGMEVIKDFFGDGKPGVKLNLFSTGPHLSKTDVKGLFREGYRGKNVEGEYGTGHGLQFIKEVVELHGGTAGYEPKPIGNNFYFILPK